MWITSFKRAGSRRDWQKNQYYPCYIWKVNRIFPWNFHPKPIWNVAFWFGVFKTLTTICWVHARSYRPLPKVRLTYTSILQGMLSWLCSQEVLLNMHHFQQDECIPDHTVNTTSLQTQPILFSHLWQGQMLKQIQQ